MQNNIYVWDNSAVTNSLIKKICESKNVDSIYYGNKRALYQYEKAHKLYEDGKELFKKLKKLNVEYIIANSEATDKKFIDIAEKLGFKIVGAYQKSTKLESSKVFSKKLMNKYNINTAKYIVAKNDSDIQYAYKNLNKPLFIKADGYAKSLSARETTEKKEYVKITNDFLNGKWKSSSGEFIIEEKITGKEISIPLILDGKNIKIFNYVKDYKKKNRKGQNTGGMGSLCPFVLSDREIEKIEDIIKKLKILLEKESLYYKGFMTINVIINDDDIFLLEINTRLGDSEGQVILELLENDIYEIIEAITNGTIHNLNLKFKNEYAIAVNIINKDYPDIKKNKLAKISKKSINDLINKKVHLFFYNNIRENENFYTQICDRFISIVGKDKNIEILRNKIYNKISKIEGNNLYFRKDIGK